jgi:8-oxo-dGTP diphosphatase
VIEDGQGRVLVAQRPPHKHLGGKWEFPGGKVEPGEQPERALVRELREELGCEVALGRALPRFTHDYGAVVIEMLPFVCQLTPGSPAPHAHEHVALRWASVAELQRGTLDLAPADVPVLAELASAQRAARA